MLGALVIIVLTMILSVKIVEIGVQDECYATTVSGLAGLIIAFYILVQLVL